MPSSRQDPATVSAPLTIEVVARKFSFEPDRIEVTEGDRVRLVVRSADGVHGLQIKRFGVNKFIPRGGEAVTIDFTASRAGTFEILCSEYCGDKHDDMKGTLVVLARPTTKIPPAPEGALDDAPSESLGFIALCSRGGCLGM